MSTSVEPVLANRWSFGLISLWYVLAVSLMFASNKVISHEDVVHDNVTKDFVIKSLTSSVPERVITLAPGATELFYSLNLGSKIVATVEYSDYPQEALDIPRIGNGVSINIESILAYEPDLIIIWESGTPKALVQQFQRFNIPVLEYKTASFEDIFLFLKHLDNLFKVDADSFIEQQRSRIEALRQAYLNKPRVKVFYQLWPSPLMTTNNKQLVSQMIRMCAGDNLFDHHTAIVPKVSLESVLALNPDVILAPKSTDGNQPLSSWQRWKSIKAVEKDNLYSVESDKISRATLRSIEGAEEICRILDRARQQLRR